MVRVPGRIQFATGQAFLARLHLFTPFIAVLVFLLHLGMATHIAGRRVGTSSHIRRSLQTVLQDRDCRSLFSCPECLGAAGCGWCDTEGSEPLCQSESDRETLCSTKKDAWIGQYPPGQMCPNTLFSGMTTEPKRENNERDAGGGGFGGSGRDSATVPEIVAHKIKKLLEAQLKRGAFRRRRFRL